MTQEEIDRLVREAQGDDHDALGEIYDLFLPSLYRYLYFRIGSQQEAEDLTEEVFFRMMKNMKKYEKKENMPFSSWLFRIAKNMLIDFYRKRVSTEEINEEVVDEKEKSSKRTESDLDRRRLMAALNFLPKMQKEAIILRYFADRTNTEISQILGKSETAIRILQSRGLKKLRLHLDPS